MRDDQRGYAAGMAWAALGIVGAAALGRPPAAAASGAEVSAYLVERQTGVIVGGTLSAVGGLLFVLFAASLADRQSQPWPATIVRLAGALLGALVVLGGVLLVGLAHAAGHLDGSATSATWTVVWPVFFAAPPLVISLLLGNAAFGLRGTRTPGWVATSAGLLAILSFLAGVAGLATADSAVLGVGFVGFVLTVAWVLAASIALWRSADVDVTATQARTLVA